MSAISSLSPVSARSTPNGFGALTSADFIRVMFAELSRQDPTRPTDSKDLLQQLGTIRSIESEVSLQNHLREMARRSEITSAGSLVGSFVEGTTDEGLRTRGYVDSVSITRLGISLNLSSGATVALSRVEMIYDPALVSTAPPPSPQTTTNPPPATQRGVSTVGPTPSDDFGSDEQSKAAPPPGDGERRMSP